MHKTYFVRANYKNYYIIFSLLYIFFCCLPMIIIVVKRIYIYEMILAMLIMLLITAMSIRFFGSRGLYVSDKKIIYKNFVKKNIKLDDIKGIKIIKSAIMTKYFTVHLYDKYKNNLYTCFFLKNTEQEMNDIVYADYHFAREYGKSILFYTVFDIKLIKYILKSNKDIEVLCDSDAIRNIITDIHFG